MRSADQTPVLDSCDLRFCWQKNGVRSASFDFPRTSEIRGENPLPRSEYGQVPFGNSPLKRENRLSAVPTDQAGRTVARPHHTGYFKEELGVRQSDITNLSDRVSPTGLSLPKKASMHAAYLL